MATSDTRRRSARRRPRRRTVAASVFAVLLGMLAAPSVAAAAGPATFTNPAVSRTEVAGGWSLALTTDPTAAPTTTTLTSERSPSTTGDPATFVATVAAGGTSVHSGSVVFTADGGTIGTASVDASGVARVSTSTLREGTHSIVATFTGSPGFLASSASVDHRVDNPTIVSGRTFCNEGPVGAEYFGSATPFPSHIAVSGLAGPITKVTAALKNISHSTPSDLDVLLSAPVPTTNLMLMSDAGGTEVYEEATIELDDDAPTGIPAPMTSGTYRPTNEPVMETRLAPTAPLVSSATTLATFDGTDPNGTWSLWVVDDTSLYTGSIFGGWCLTITTADTDATPPTVVVAADPATATGRNGWYTTPPVLSFTAIDDRDPAPEVQVSVDGGAFAAHSGPLELTQDGVHTVDARAVDAAGNESDVARTTVKKDATAPHVAAAATGSRRVSLTATDAASGVSAIQYRYVLRETTASSSWRAYAHPVLAGAGSYLRLEYRAVDLAGNVSAVGRYENQSR